MLIFKEINRKDRKRRRKNSLKNWSQFAEALEKRRTNFENYDFIELPKNFIRSS